MVVQTPWEYLDAAALLKKPPVIAHYLLWNKRHCRCWAWNTSSISVSTSHQRINGPNGLKWKSLNIMVSIFIDINLEAENCSICCVDSKQNVINGLTTQATQVLFETAYHVRGKWQRYIQADNKIDFGYYPDFHWFYETLASQPCTLKQWVITWVRLSLSSDVSSLEGPRVSLK